MWALWLILHHSIFTRFTNISYKQYNIHQVISLSLLICIKSCWRLYTPVSTHLKDLESFYLLFKITVGSYRKTELFLKVIVHGFSNHILVKCSLLVRKRKIIPHKINNNRFAGVWLDQSVTSKAPNWTWCPLPHFMVVIWKDFSKLKQWKKSVCMHTFLQQVKAPPRANGCSLLYVLQEGEVSEHERKPGGWTHS